MTRGGVLDADFALDLGPGADEDLPLPQDTDPAFVRRVGRPVAYLAVAALVAGCLVRVDHDGGGAQPAAQEVPTARPAAVITRHAAAARPYGGSLVSDDQDVRCPAGLSCRTSVAVPPQLEAAVRAVFPAASSFEVRTVTARTGLVRRYLHARTSASDITVQVTPGRSKPSRVLAGTGGSALATVQRPVGSHTVVVTVAGTGAGVRASSATVRLAGDDRLVAVR